MLVLLGFPTPQSPSVTAPLIGELRVSKKPSTVKIRDNITVSNKAFSLGRRWQKSLIFDGCGVKKLAAQGIFTYCATRTLPYHLYADECELLVLSAPLTSVSLSKKVF